MPNLCREAASGYIHSTMQQRSITAHYLAHVHAKVALKSQGGPKRVSHGHYRNTQAALAAGNAPDGLFLLRDYRDNSKTLARRTMNRLEAWKLNKRLEGTGMAWALTSP